MPSARTSSKCIAQKQQNVCVCVAHLVVAHASTSGEVSCCEIRRPKKGKKIKTTNVQIEYNEMQCNS